MQGALFRCAHLLPTLHSGFGGVGFGVWGLGFRVYGVGFDFW